MKKPVRRQQAFAIAVFAALAVTPMAWAGDVRVRVTGAGTEGDVVVSLCAEVQYPRWAECATQRQPARENSAPLLFENITPGRYAVIAYQDRNHNGRLDLGCSARRSSRMAPRTTLRHGSGHRASATWPSAWATLFAT